MFAYLRFLVLDFAYVYGRAIASRILEFVGLFLAMVPGLEQYSLACLQRSMRYDHRQRIHLLLLDRKDELALVRPSFRGEESARKAISSRALVMKNPTYHGMALRADY